MNQPLRAAFSCCYFLNLGFKVFPGYFLTFGLFLSFHGFWWVTKMLSGLGQLLCEERLRESKLFSLEKRQPQET